MRFFIGCQKRHTSTKLTIEAIGGKQSIFISVELRLSDGTERDCFRQIISVSGIGPKTALTILSAINYREFIEMISKGDYVPLTSVSGVGRKTAERLSVELKDKIKKAGGMADKAFRTTAGSASNRAYEDISALISLGYNRAEA